MKKQLLSRLLRLYPVKTLRSVWGVGGKGKEVTAGNVIEETTEKDIITFCRDNHAITKQHVFLFDIPQRGEITLPDPLLRGHTPHFPERLNENIQEFYLLNVVYTLVVGPEYREIELVFPWPITVLVEGATIIVHFTILEKNLNAYLPTGETAVKSWKNIDEGDVVRLINTAPDGSILFQKLDINRGIKTLWANDRIDALYSRWKEARSTHTQAMDDGFLLKRDDFNRYQQAVQGPLLDRTVFRVLNIVGGAPDVFAVDATNGELFFNRYSNPGEVRNVVREILRAN